MSQGLIFSRSPLSHLMTENTLLYITAQYIHHVDNITDDYHINRGLLLHVQQTHRHT